MGVGDHLQTNFMSEPQEVLFIGGPRDGEMDIVPDGCRDINVVESTGLHIRPIEPEDGEFVPTPHEVYVCKAHHLATGKKSFLIYVESHLTAEQGFERLIYGYTPYDGK